MTTLGQLMQLNQTIKVAMLSACACIPFSMSHAAPIQPQGNFYIGGGIGPTATDSDHETGLSRHHAIAGFIGEVNTGYRYIFANHLRLAGEVAYDWRTPNYMDTTNYSPGFKIQSKHSYEFRFMPGYQLNERLGLYAITGIGSFRQQYHWTNTYKANLTFFQVGMGGDYQFTRHIGMRTDLMYLKSWQHKDFTQNGGADTFETDLSALDAIFSIYAAF